MPFSFAVLFTWNPKERAAGIRQLADAIEHGEAEVIDAQLDIPCAAVRAGGGAVEEFTMRVTKPCPADYESSRAASVLPNVVLSVPMTEERVREILGANTIRAGAWLVAGDAGGRASLMWKPGDQAAGLFDTFTADELEAVAWWMRNKGGA